MTFKYLAVLVKDEALSLSYVAVLLELSEVEARSQSFHDELIHRNLLEDLEMGLVLLLYPFRIKMVLKLILLLESYRHQRRSRRNFLHTFDFISASVQSSWHLALRIGCKRHCFSHCIFFFRVYLTIVKEPGQTSFAHLTLLQLLLGLLILLQQRFFLRFGGGVEDEILLVELLEGVELGVGAQNRRHSPLFRIHPVLQIIDLFDSAQLLLPDLQKPVVPPVLPHEILLGLEQIFLLLQI